MGSHEVAGKDYVSTKNYQITCYFHLHKSHKQLNPCTNSSVSRVVIHSQLSVLKGKMGPFEGNPSTRGCQTGLSRPAPIMLA